MADLADMSDDRIELELELARSKRNPTLIPTGYCFYCNETLGSSRLFCDADCRDDYQHEQQAKQRAGLLK